MEFLNIYNCREIIKNILKLLRKEGSSEMDERESKRLREVYRREIESVESVSVDKINCG